MSMDGQALAGVKNRVGKSQLNAELYRIDREKKAEMRMHNTSKQRFRAKHAKLDYYNERGKDASDVRMYETHNPGFCYRRNGECRIPQSSAPAPKVDYQNDRYLWSSRPGFLNRADMQVPEGINIESDKFTVVDGLMMRLYENRLGSTDLIQKDIHSLLFTNGEVDMEKVLCLHLLTAHRTESLTPPAKYHRALSFLTKEQSPLERLIERSRKRRQEDSLTKLLPTYVLDVKTQKQQDASKGKEEVLITDGRLAERVIINDKITQLVHTVMAALQESNPEKMEEFTAMAKDPERLNRIIDKPHIQEFLKSLNGQMIVSSCEAFHLTQPFKATTVPLTLESTGESLKNLVKHIRKNVLQFPEQGVWKSMYYKSQSRETEYDSSADLDEGERKRPKKDLSSSPSKGSLAVAEDQSGTKRKNKMTSKFRSTSTPVPGRSAKTTVRNKGSPKGKPSYNANVKGSKTDRNEAIRDEEPSSSTIGSEKILFDFDFLRGPSSTLSSKATINKRVRKNFHQEGSETSTGASTVTSKGASAVISKEQNQASSIETQSDELPTLQMTCPDCMKKWDNPNITKVRQLKKRPLPTLDNVTDEDINSGSIKRLSMMVDREIKMLNLAERRPSRTSKTSGSTTPASKSLPPFKKLETVTLDVLDLARIGQEIRENETRKKVDKFLGR